MRSAEVSRELAEYVAPFRRGWSERRHASMRFWFERRKNPWTTRRHWYPAAEHAAVRVLFAGDPKRIALWTTMLERERVGLPTF